MNHIKFFCGLAIVLISTPCLSQLLDTTLQHTVGAGEHGAVVRFNNPVIKNSTRLYNYSAEVEGKASPDSTGIMKVARVQASDIEMLWHQDSFKNQAIVIFTGTISPSTPKDAYFSKFSGIMEGLRGKQNSNPDLKWDFQGKLETTKLRLVDCHQPWNYAEMDMADKALEGKRELLIGVMEDDTVRLKVEGFSGEKLYYSHDLRSDEYGHITKENPIIKFSGVTGLLQKTVILRMGEKSNEYPIIWTVTIFPKNYRRLCYTLLLGEELTTSGLFPCASTLLSLFINPNTDVPHCQNLRYTLDVRDKRLSHNCGATFDSNGNANIPQFTFGSNSDMANSITNPERENSFAKFIHGIAENKEANTKKQLEDLEIGEQKDIVWTDLGEKHIVLDTPYDLKLAFNRILFRITNITYRYKKLSSNTAESTSVKIKGQIEDLYDFEYKNGVNIRSKDIQAIVNQAAVLQIGEGKIAGDIAGKIFLTIVDLDAEEATIIQIPRVSPIDVPTQKENLYHHRINL